MIAANTALKQYFEEVRGAIDTQVAAKITELEQRFSAGQSDIVSLANAILASAEANVAIVQHKTELMQKKLETASGLTQPCAVINICKDVHQLFSTK